MIAYNHRNRFRASVVRRHGGKGTAGEHRPQWLEALERRTLLSIVVPSLGPAAASAVTIQGTAGADTISVTVGNGGTLIATVNGATTTYTPAQYSGGITIDTGGSPSQNPDVLTIAALPSVATSVHSEGKLNVTLGTDSRGLRDIAAPRLVVGNGHSSGMTVNIDDVGDPAARTASFDQTTDTSGTSFEIVQGLGPGDIWFSTADATSSSINTGTGADILNFNALQLATPTDTTSLFVNGQGTHVDATGNVWGLAVDGKPNAVSLLLDEAVHRKFLETVNGDATVGYIRAPIRQRIGELPRLGTDVAHHH